MRLIFMGTPGFAVPTLEALLLEGHELVAAYTRAPKPAGRGQKLTPSPVHLLAESANIPVRYPASLKDLGVQAEFAGLKADAAIVVAYGLLLPEAILKATRLGAFNLHASLLPRWRGAAPIQRAIMAGDAETGVMVMRMEIGLDTGPVLKTARTPITSDTAAGTLTANLARMGADLMVEALRDLEAGRAVETAQPDDGVTYAKKISNEETRIDWSKSSHEIDRQIRGLSPAPGAWTRLEGERLKILRAIPVEGHGSPGQVLDQLLTIACGRGALRPLVVQKAGKASQDTPQFLRGHAVPAGAMLG